MLVACQERHRQPDISMLGQGQGGGAGGSMGDDDWWFHGGLSGAQGAVWSWGRLLGGLEKVDGVRIGGIGTAQPHGCGE